VQEQYLSINQAIGYTDKSYTWLRKRVLDGSLPNRGTKQHPRFAKYDLDTLLTPIPVLPSQERERDFYTLEEVAHRLSIPLSSLRRMATKGDIEVVNLTGKQRRGAKYRITKSEYTRFVQSRELVPVAY
jgi:predicted amidophosphoribosyltransferase